MDLNTSFETPAKRSVCTIDSRLHQQIANVIAGRTAFGEMSPLPRLSIAPHSVLGATAEDHIKIMLVLLEPRVPAAHTDHFRTALIWKMLDYFCKTGLRRYKPGLLQKLHAAVNWISNHLHAVSEPIGFAKIIELGEQMAIARKVQWQSFAASQLEPLRLEMNPPPRPVAWEDGPYRLERLNHPFHFFEEGVRMKNCLADVPKIEVLPGEFAISPACLSDSICWWTNRQRYSEHYSFRVGNGFAATFEICKSAIIGFQLAFQDQPLLFAVMARALRALEYDTGPLRVGPAHNDGRALAAALESATEDSPVEWEA